MRARAVVSAETDALSELKHVAGDNDMDGMNSLSLYRSCAPATVMKGGEQTAGANTDEITRRNNHFRDYKEVCNERVGRVF